MPFFKFESFGFIVSLGITLLLCGLIMFYVRQRFAAYDRHLIEQSELLKHLVSNIQTNMGSSSELASSSAIKTAQLIHNRKNVDENNEKIIVSDDEIDSDSESESESDSETSVSDSDSEDENKNNKCETLGKCPILPFGNMLTTLMSVNNSSNKKNMSEKDTNEDTNEDSDEESIDSSCDSLSRESLSDDERTKEQIKHIDFSKKLDDIKVLGNDDIDSSLNVHNLDISFEEISNKNNILDEIHVTKLNDVIEDDIEKSDNSETKQKPIFNLKDLSKKALQDLCKDRKLPINGTRGELINRLSQ